MATKINTPETGMWLAAGYEATRERAWHLSILAAPDLYAWGVHALDSGDAVALGWAQRVDALDAPEIPLHAATVSFVTLPEWSTLVPDSALEPGTEARHLSLVHGGLPTGALRDESVASLAATCIYVHDDVAEHAVLDRFPNARAVPIQALMVRSALARSNAGPVLLLNRSHDRLDAAIADSGRLLLSNTYPAKASQDVLYYALLAVEGCGSRPADVTVHCGGTHLTGHEGDLLRRYFIQLQPALEMPADAVKSAVEPPRWLAVLEQFACVS